MIVFSRPNKVIMKNEFNFTDFLFRMYLKNICDKSYEHMLLFLQHGSKRTNS